MRAVVIHAERDLRVEESAVAALDPGAVKVRVRCGGICGSDLHYYQHGGFGTVRVRQPMILGHEVAGEVVEVGSAVTRMRVGQKVAVNPSLPCDQCRFCLEGRQQHCLDMRFFGSAMRMPHVQGAFREMLVCPERQLVPFPDDLPFAAAAFAEPLSVALHAVNQAGALNGRRVLVTGAGPIGALCVLAARWAGAREVVATDILDPPLKAVKKAGADLTVNMRAAPEGLDRFAADKGWFDVAFECSGNAAALASALNVCRPGATIVQVGLAGGEVAVPLNMVVAKEISLRGTFRFHAEFALAVETIARGAIDVVPLLTATVPFADARMAFDLAADRTRSMKVQLAF